jgi:hypothetical protein
MSTCPTMIINLHMVYLVVLYTQNIFSFRRHNNCLRGKQMNVYIKVINLKGTKCFDPY